jgi:hypothetical protein
MTMGDLLMGVLFAIITIVMVIVNIRTIIITTRSKTIFGMSG